MLTVADVTLASLETLLAKYELSLQVIDEGAAITGSYWGGREAGIGKRTVFVRGDTPIHSFLHEICHIICMSAARRAQVETDAGGDDLEEAAVCYLQLILADEVKVADRNGMMRDMDEWGYSFRLGDTRSWFERDAEDAYKWLIENDLLTNEGKSTFRLRA